MTTRTLIESECSRRTSSLMRLTKFSIRLMVVAVWALLAVSTSHAADPKTLSVTVRLEKTSAVPDPKKSLYSHCLVMHKAMAIKGLDGAPREIIVAFWGFRDRKLDVGSACKPGDYLEVQLVPWEQTDVKVRETRQSDEIVEPDLDLYWANASTVLTGETREQAERLDKLIPAVAADRMAQAKPATRPAAPTGPGVEKSSQLRAAAIQADKDRIAAALQRNGGSFAEWHKRLQPFYEDINRQFQSPDLEWKVLSRGKHMISDPPKFGFGANGIGGINIEELVRFNAELRERGTDLILLPVPVKQAFASVYFSEKAPADHVVAVNHQWFMQQLLENDIEVIDLLPVFQAAADDSPETPYIYNFNRDHHWSSGGRMAAARALAERLERYDFSRQYPPETLTLQTAKALCDEGNEGKHYPVPGSYLKGKQYPVFQVGLKGGGRLPLLRTSEDNAAVKGSPILLAGDSMLGEGMNSIPGVTFADYLAYASGVLPVVVPENYGSETTRKIKRNLLDGRRVFVVVFLLWQG
jgi:hypothetical protein